MTTKLLSIEGIDNIPTHGPMIIATNHIHWWNLIGFGKSLSQIFRLTDSKPCLLSAKPLVLLHPFIRLFAIPIYLSRNNSSKDSLAIERAIDYLKKGHSLIISPEGKHNNNKLITAKTGVALIAIQSAVPILPVALYKKTLKIGPAIRVSQTNINSTVLADLTGKVMQEIALLLPEAMRGIYKNKP